MMIGTYMKHDILKKIKFMNHVILFFIILFFQISCYALPFSITPKAGTALPTVIHPGITLTAYYTIANNTLTPQRNNYIKYLPLNVSQITIGNYNDTCGSTFNLSAKGQAGSSCTLQLSITGPVDRQDKNPHHHLFACFSSGITCAGTNYPLNIIKSSSNLIAINVTPLNASIDIHQSQQYTATGIYLDHTASDLTNLIAWHSSNSSVANISANGVARGLGTGTTAISGIFDGVTSNSTTLRIKSFIYVVNVDLNAVSYCSVSSDGNVYNCQLTGNDFDFPFGIEVNRNTTYAYITNNNNNTVSYCPINIDGSFDTCQTTGNGFNAPFQTALNPAETYLYVTNQGSNTVSYCVVNINGALGSCQITGSGFNQPAGIAINANGTIAYITNLNSNTISYCTINPNGSFSACQTTASGFSSPSGVTLNPEGTRAYIATNLGTTVSYCMINSNGSLSNCDTAGNEFMAPSDVAFNSDGTDAYIVNSGDSTVTHCAVNSDGRFDSCQTTGGGFSTPIGIRMS